MPTIVGIDPSTTKLAIAIKVDGEYTDLLNLTLLELLAYAHKLPEDTVYYVEDPESMKSPHARFDFHKGITVEKIYETIRFAQNIANRVGQCAGAAKLAIQTLQQLGKDVRTIKPKRGISKKTKNDSAIFNKMTGWQGRSNHNTRDAAMLIFDLK